MMTVKNKPARDTDACHFLCVHGSAVINFTMPRKEVAAGIAKLDQRFKETGKSQTAARREAEESLRDGIERGLHLRPEHNFTTAMFIVWLTVTSDAGRESPNAAGYVLEFSDIPLPGRNPGGMAMIFTSLGTGESMLSRSKPSGAFKHYWTEDSVKQVRNLTKRFKARATGVWSLARFLRNARSNRTLRSVPVISISRQLS